MGLTEARPATSLAELRDQVGDEGPVTCVGGRTHWDVGGAVDPAAREVRAPAGIVEHVPAERTVLCGAGTTVAELAEALAAHGQMVPLDPADPARATVGGVLAVGRSGPRRLGYGPVRDLLLEARYVSAAGRLVKAGGPTVKNVSGFDLCRLLVGSVGTIGIIGEVVLRVRPVPAASRWLAGTGDPLALRRSLYGASSILWDGTTTWVLLEGAVADVATEAGSAALAGFTEVPGPPPLPSAGRLSVRPAELRELPARLSVPGASFVAEVGVGVVHVDTAVPPARPVDPELHLRVKRHFDPSGRLNPGRTVI